MSKFFSVEKQYKTKPIWLFLITLLIGFLPLLIVWILLGDINALNLFWMFPQNGIVWHGVVTNDNIDYLFNTYSQYNPSEITMSSLSSELNNNVALLSADIVFNPLILAVMFSCLAFAILFPICLRLLKLTHLDVIPMCTSFCFTMMIFMFSGLIPYFSQSLSSVWYIVRILIALVGGLIFFILSNWLTNAYLSTRPYAVDVMLSYMKQDEINQVYKQELKKSLAEFKNSDKTYVDVEMEKKDK